MEVWQRNERLSREEVRYRNKDSGLLSLHGSCFTCAFFLLLLPSPLLVFIVSFTIWPEITEAEKRMSHEVVQKCLECCYVLQNVFESTIFKDTLYRNSDTKMIKWKNKKSVYSRYLRAQFRMFKSIGSTVRPVLNC